MIPNLHIMTHLHLKFIAICFCILASFSLCSQSLLINEFMADNSSTIADEANEFEDWIEIYNSGSSAIDIGGYYISDDLAEPTLYQIPTSNSAATTIPAGGFLLLWADKDLTQGILHIDLKLGAGGEDIILTQADGLTVEDQLTFGTQSENVSYGRTTDGGVDFDFFPAATPGTSNEAVSFPMTYSVSISKPIVDALDDGVQYGISNGSVNLEGYGIKMVESWSNQKIGLRFRDLEIPQGATILSASIQFTAKDEDEGVGDCNLDFEGDDSDDAAPFEDENMNFSNRNKTSIEIEWEPDQWLIRDFASDKQKTPDLSGIVQEIVNRSGWEYGNNMAFIIHGNGLRSSHNFESGFPAVLNMEIEVPIPTTAINNIYINEISPNGTNFQDENENYEDWIELYNANNFDVSLGGLYLTDDYDELLQWQISEQAVIPANGYLVIFADEETDEGGLHANFKLGANGEELALVQVLNNEIVIIDSLEYSAVPFKASTGRTIDGGNDWMIFGESTPLASNENADLYLAVPVISLANGIYTGSESVTITHPDPAVTIRYTTDGSIPGNSSDSYNNPITIDESGSLRAVAFRSGYAASEPATASYLFNVDHDLPVLHIVTDPDNLFDDEIGIYTVGTNGVAFDFCGDAEEANYNQDDWERPANLTLYKSDNSQAFQVNAGIQIGGSCSREQALKSLNIYLRSNQYGDKDIDYKLFPGKDYKKYKRLKLRNSGQDFRSTMFRDAAVHDILHRVPDMTFQAYQPAVIYINDEYWGIQNFREFYSDEYFDYEKDIKEEDLQLIKNPSMGTQEIKEGDDVHYRDLYYFVETNDLSQQVNYDYIKSQIDIDNFINYWISMCYIAADDWPANNMLLYREDKPGGKWRYITVDTDASTNHYGVNSNTGHLRNKLAKIQNANAVTWPNRKESTHFFRNLLENDEFKHEFTQRTCSFIHLAFDENDVLPIIDSLRLNIDSEMEDHIDRWKFDTPFLQDYDEWIEKVDKMKLFFEERPPYVRQHFRDTLGMGDNYDLSINFDANTNGHVLVNSNEMEIPYNYEGIYFEDIPLRLRAVADPGYVFVEWLETGETDEIIDFVSTGDFTLTPIFESDTPILTLDCPENMELTVSGSTTSTLVTWTEPEVTTTCTEGVTSVTQTNGLPNGAAFPIGTTTLSYEANDDCGNTETCLFNITVTLDNGALTFNCPADVSITAAPGASSAMVSWTEPTASTSCPLGNQSVSQTTGPANGANFGIGLTTVSYTATDDCGNTVNCSFDVTVLMDNGTLTLDCPADIIVNALPGATNVSVFWDSPVGSSTCVVGDVITTQTGGNPSGSSFPIGNTTISYQATDACDNLLNCSFTIIVNSSNSTIGLNCPENISLIAPVGSTGEVVNWTAPIGTSDCTTGTTTTNQIEGMASGNVFDIGSYQITYEVLDGCANSTTCSFTITVLDGSGTLTMECPSDQTLILPQGATTIPITWSLPTTSTTCGGGTANPNCGTVPEGFTIFGNFGDSEYFLSDNKLPWPAAQADCENYGGNIVVVGDQAEDDFLGDNISTVIHLGMSDVNTEGNFEWINGEAATYTNFSSSANNTATNDYVYKAPWSSQKWGVYSNLVYKYYVMELDCGGGSSIALTQTSGPVNGSVQAAGLYTITYEAMDDCGGFQVCSFTIEIQDNPETISIDCPSNISLTETPGTGNAIVSWSPAIASTTCSGGGLTLTQTGGSSSGSSFPIGTHLITYEANDACNNPVNCSFTVTVAPDAPQTDYCESQGDAPWQQWISNVSFNEINNESGKSQYSDFTDEISAVETNATYAFSLTPAFSYTQWDEYVRVWIDYNKDNDFTDAGEMVFEAIIPAGASNSTPNSATGNIVIPSDISNGATRMRVSMKKEAFAMPCESFPFGEVEDYTLVISQNGNGLEGASSEVLFFNAMRSGREVALNWVTNTEYKNDHFAVERSLDGENFELLYEVDQTGSSDEVHYYEGLDENPVQGVNYYRLRQVYRDGSFRFSTVERIVFNVDIEDFNLFPNPTKDILYLNLKEYVGMEADVQVFNALGQRILRKQLDEISEEVTPFDVSTFYNGIYTISVKVKDRKRMTRQFVVNR